MSENNPMPLGKRIKYLKDEIIYAKTKLQEIKDDDGDYTHSAGFYEGSLGSLIDELEYLEGLYNGNQAY